jgi:hypothetical protein
MVTDLPSGEMATTLTLSLWSTSRSEDATTIMSPGRHATASIRDSDVAPALAV